MLRKGTVKSFVFVIWVLLAIIILTEKVLAIMELNPKNMENFLLLSLKYFRTNNGYAFLWFLDFFMR